MKIRWLKRAVQNLHQAILFIAADNPKAAEGVAQRIQEAVENLSRYPYIGRTGRIEKTRELNISQLPFVICYRVKGEWIEILRIYHCAQLWPQ